MPNAHAAAAALFLSCAGLDAQAPQGFFDAPMVVLPEDSPPFQRLFDCDGDGDMDAVGSRVYSDGTAYEVTVWRNQGGRFTSYFHEVRSPGGMGGTWIAMRIATGDFDGDGRQDFVAAEGFFANIYTNTGAGFVRTSLPLAQRASDAAAADFDGDGRDDLAVFCRDSGTGPSGFVWLRRANGTSTTVPMPASLPPFTRLEVVDLDGDNRPDLGAWQQSRNEFHPLDYHGGTLLPGAPLVLFPALAGGASFWSSGDIDGDGDADLLGFELPNGVHPARVHCWRRTGPASFAAELPYEGGPAEFLADFDGDGDLDGVCCGGGTNPPPTWPRLNFGSRFELSVNDGTGRLARAFGLPGKGSLRMAGVADVDGDGTPDLVAGGCVHYQRQPLGEATAVSVGLEPLELFQVPSLRRQLGDHDRDGDADFLFSLTRRGRNDGSGAVRVEPRPGSPLPSGFETTQPQFLGDFDGDGAVDLLVPVLQSGPNTPFSHMALCRNNGSGELLPAAPAGPPGLRIGWRALAWITGLDSGFAADIDGDGDQDVIAVADANYEAVMRSEIFHNQGGQFAAGPVLAGERIDVVADFDGDQLPDIVTRTSAIAGVQLRLGTGNPAAPFGPRLPVFPAFTPDLNRESFRAVDCNGDGRLDLVVRTDLGALRIGVLVLTNTTVAPGQPAFVANAALLPELGYGLGFVDVADVDGDGRTDFLVHSPADGAWTVRVFRRLGGDGVPLLAQHLAPPVAQAVPGGHAADADGDGDVDLVGAWTVRNVTHHGVAAGYRQQYGSGTAGELGLAPLLGASGPLRAGGTKQLRLSGIPGPTVGLLAISGAGADLPNFPLPGVRCHVDPGLIFATILWVLPANGGGTASGSASFTIPLPAAAQGLTFHDQVFLLDAAGPGGVTSSNGLLARVGG